MSRARIAMLALFLAACGSEAAPPLVWLRVRAPSGVEARALVWEPALEAVEDRSFASGDRVLAFARGPRSMRFSAPGACPTDVSLDEDAKVVRLAPWIEVPSELAQVGFDAPFEIEVRPGCQEAVAGRVSWRVVSGAALAELTERRRGFLFAARTGPPVGLPREGRPGILPVSPRTARQTILEARWEGAGAPVVVRRVRVSAATRATGLASVPLGHRVLLRGEGWSVSESPEGAHGRVEPGSIASLLVDVAGEWRLRDAAGAELLLRVGRFDTTPLDCGRAECHASAAEHGSASPMSTALSAALERASSHAACALRCHVLGESGTADGGFAHVAREMERDPARVLRASRVDALPAALRRLGGVGCTGCHGPGAIPAAESRWAILRSDVCATCHDAPPRYGHVAAWRRSSMSTSDAITQTREGACARCHTTAGFLATIGVEPARTVPDDARIGIACAACHAPHAPTLGHALLREVPLPASLAALADGVEVPDASRACVACHAPDVEGAVEGLASVTSGASPFGVGPGGAAEGPHARVEGGCVGCHRGGPEALSRGRGHSFEADAAACASCHEETTIERARERSSALHARATALWDRLVAEGAVSGPAEGHAQSVAILDPSRADAARAARWVLADPAVAAHAGALADGWLAPFESAAVPSR